MNHLVCPSVYAKFVFGPFLSHRETMKVLIHTKIANDLRLCLHLDPILFGQSRGHLQEKCKIHVRSISFLWRNIGSLYFTQKLPLTLECAMILTQSHFGKVKVIDRKSTKFVSGSYLFEEETLEVLTSHKDCLCPENVLTLTQGQSGAWLKKMLSSCLCPILYYLK